MTMTWWHEDDLRFREDPGQWGEPFGEHLLALLDDVEAAYTANGTPREWPDPHDDPEHPGNSLMPRDEEYSRVTDPAKYAILETRLDAWIKAITARGLASLHDTARNGSEQIAQWQGDAGSAPSRVVSLIPHTDAPSLHVALWRADDGNVGLQVGVSDPAVEVLNTPDCGCDACDSGSADLLEEFDRWMLSIVDGSIAVTVADGHREQCTSFSANSGDESQFSGRERRVSVRGASWTPGRISRALVPAP